MKTALAAWSCCALITASIAGGETLTPTPVNAWERVDGLPASRQGRFPVMVPKYEGVDQLILFSARHLVLVTHNTAEVFNKVNELSSGKFFTYIREWDECDPTNHPNWTAYKGRHSVYLEYEARAREAAGERRLDEARFFSITGNDDHYGRPRPPVRVTRMIASLGGDRVGPFHGQLKGATEIFHAHYSYLELPDPLEQGRTYTVALEDGRKVTFVYDETRSISQAIKLNQMGYLSDATTKYAYLGASFQDLGPVDFSFAKEFKVVSVQSGEVVFTGAIRLREKNPRFTVPPGRKDDPATRPLIAGEDVYELDLAGLKAEGDFFITIPGVGRSWTFHHGPDTYGEAFYTACRLLYHQRCGIALSEPYTAWPRIACHKEPIYESENLSWPSGSDFKSPRNYDRFDVVGGTIDTNRATLNPQGGWHDAADWDRNDYHFNCVFDLLNAYELFPAKFTDNQLNIPESGNGIPDILDEAEYGMQIWKLSMTPEGGVSGHVETCTHPTIDEPKVHYTFGQRTRWDSLLFASAAAQYALLVKPFNKAKCEEYSRLAQRAYTYGNDPKHSLGKLTIHARHNRGAGAPYTLQWEETDEMVKPYLISARSRLALLTGDAAYLKEIPQMTEKVLMPYQWPNAPKDFTAWLYFPIAGKLAGQLPTNTVNKFKAFLVKAGMDSAALNEKMPYRLSLARFQDYWLGWGSITMYNLSKVQLIANALEPSAALRDAALQNADFMLGANPMGLSFTTGLGMAYPIDIQHEVSEHDGIMDPVPGITVYGPTGGSFPQLRNEVWRAPVSGTTNYVNFISAENLRRPVLRQFAVHPHVNTGQCEFTIWETCSSAILTFAALMPEGWKPSEELTHRQPRQDAFLFGYYYLP